MALAVGNVNASERLKKGDFHEGTYIWRDHAASHPAEL